MCSRLVAIAATAAAAVATTAAFATAAAEAATATAAAEAAATTAAAATKAAAAAAARLHRTGFVHHQGAAALLLAVHALDGGLRLGGAAHFDKAEALGAAGVTFHHDLGAGDGAELAESLFHVAVAESVGKVPHVEFVAHVLDS